MISVAAIRMQQFGVQFYQASLTRQRHRQAGPVRGAQLRRTGPAGPRRPQESAAPPSKVNWDLLERRIAVEREGLPAADHPQEDRRARPVLRAVPPGARPALDSRRRDHLVRRGAEVRAGRAGRIGRHAEGAGARRHPARHRRPAPAARAARRHRSFRRRALHRAGGHLRSAARGSRRPDVRDDQREAHAAQCVAPRLALRAASCIATRALPPRTTSSAR